MKSAPELLNERKEDIIKEIENLLKKYLIDEESTIFLFVFYITNQEQFNNSVEWFFQQYFHTTETISKEVVKEIEENYLITIMKKDTYIFMLLTPKKEPK